MVFWADAKIEDFNLHFSTDSESHEFKFFESGFKYSDMFTGCVRQNENPTEFKIVKIPLLVQKQPLHQQKALDFCYLEP